MAERKSQDQAQSLIDGINAEVDGEIAAILTQAQAEAAVTLANAHKAQRQKMRAAIAELRRTRDRSQTRAEAGLETQRRQMHQASAFQSLSEGLATLPAALEGLWQDKSSRTIWCSTLIAEAGQRLLPGSWVLEHPETLPDAEVKALKAALRKHAGKAVSAVSVAGLDAGLRVRADSACVDGSIPALCGDKQKLSAQFLNALEHSDCEDQT